MSGRPAAGSHRRAPQPRRLVLLGAGLYASLCCLALGQGGTRPGEGRLLVLSKQAHTLAMVDPATLEVEATAPVGDDPHEVIASADGRTAFISNYGFGALHTLTIVDLVSRRTTGTVELGALSGPHGLAVQGGAVWFTAEGAKAFARYDPAARAIDLIVGTGQDRTHMIWISPDGEHVITANVNSGTVSFFDEVARPSPPGPPPARGGGSTASPGPPSSSAAMPPGKDWKQTVVQTGNGPEGFDVSPDGRVLWVGNGRDGTVTVVDMVSRQVSATLPLRADGINRLRFTPDGRHVLLSGRGETPLTIVDADSHAVVKRLRLGTGAAGILMEPGGRRAFVACSPDNYVAVIDLRSMSLVGRIDAGGEPDGLAWAPAPR